MSVLKQSKQTHSACPGSGPFYDLGILNITAATRSLGEVEIVAEKSSMVLSLDENL
jgi:hypothetical protein